METPQDKGRQFEIDLAAEFGLKRVPGSGSVWHSKLDLVGNKARWSLKATGNPKFPITFEDILEALDHCYGLGGDGATPLWAARTPVGDFVVMRKEDFKELSKGDLKIITTEKPQVAARKARARQPELMRDLDLEGLPLDTDKGKIS